MHFLVEANDNTTLQRIQIPNNELSPMGHQLVRLNGTTKPMLEGGLEGSTNAHQPSNVALVARPNKMLAIQKLQVVPKVGMASEMKAVRIQKAHE